MGWDSFCSAFPFVRSPSLHPQLQNRSRYCSTFHSYPWQEGLLWGFDHCGFVFHPVCSQHMLFAHNQTLCCFSAVSCIPTQKYISVPVNLLEIHFFGNPFTIQSCTSIQLQTSILKVFWKH